MSKMMDTLERASHDEIARTYFHTTPQKRAERGKNGWKAVLPWAVALGAIAIAATALLFKSSIDIKVRIMGEVPEPAAKNTGIFFVRGAMPDKDIVKNIRFAGDAKEFSYSKPDELVLCNSRGAGWANYTIELKEPIDLNNFDIKYTARGTRGDETLILAVVDSNNRSYRLEKDLSSCLSDKWQEFTINFKRVKKAVDFSNIAAIKFEFGHLTAGNYPSAVLFLKDIYITKTRRLKWL